MQAWKAIRAIREEAKGELRTAAAPPAPAPAAHRASCFSFVLGSGRSGAKRNFDVELEALRSELRAKRQGEELLFVSEGARQQWAVEDKVAAANRRLCCPISGLLMTNPVTAIDGVCWGQTLWRVPVLRACCTLRGFLLMCMGCRSYIRATEHRSVVRADTNAAESRHPKKDAQQVVGGMLSAEGCGRRSAVEGQGGWAPCA